MGEMAVEWIVSPTRNCHGKPGVRCRDGVAEGNEGSLLIHAVFGKRRNAACFHG